MVSTARARGRRTALKTILVRGLKVVLVVLIAFLSYVGLLHLTRGTAMRHVRGIPADGGIPVAVSDPEFSLNVALLTGGALAPGNRISVALNGDGTYPPLFDDLRSAKYTITLQAYYGKPGAMTEALGKILIDRAKHGVKIFILYDAFGAQNIPDDHVQVLRQSGINIEPFRPLRLSTLHLVQNRSHVRGVVIDGRIGWTGGFGIDDKWFGDGRTNGSWRETNVRFEGPAVRQLQAVFAASWVEATGVLFTGRLTVTEHPDGVPAGVLYATPTLGSTSAERFYALSLAGAREKIYITNAYFSPEQNFIDLLIGAARRGVDVRVLTAGPATDVKAVLLAGRAWYETLLAGGVKVYEWQPTVMHAKTFVIDGQWSTIGSMNFDNRSLALNEEATLMVMDRGIGEEMNRIFIEDLKYATEITAADFSRRSRFQRLAEKGARLLTRFL